MHVRVLSDVHLEFGDYDPGTGDVLVLAGDICGADDIDLYLDFFHKCVENYNKVFYVMGNHEAYGSDSLHAAEWRLRNHLPDGISLMNNTSIYYEGVHFVGATLWTNFENMNLELMEQAGQYMNDYHQCKTLTPEETLGEHIFTREWLERAIPTLRGPVFMITHHAPSYESVHGHYLATRGAYASNMEEFIRKHDNILWWASGHVHHSNDYHIGQCHMISNPRGYYPDSLNEQFDPSMSLDVSA